MQPIGTVNLGLNALTPIGFPLWWVVQWFGSYPLAFNSIIFVALTLTGLWTTVYLQRISGSFVVGLVGGTFFLLFPPLRNAAENAHLNLLGAFFYPVTLLLWDQIVKTRQWAWAVLLGLTFWLMWLTDGMWLLLSVPLLVPYGMWTLIRERQRAVYQLILCGFLALGVLGLLSYGIAPFRQANSFDRSLISPADRVAAERWSLDWDTYVFMPEDVNVGRSLGRGLMALVSVSVFIKSPYRERWLWFGVGVVCMVLSIGPDVTLAGQRIDLPYWYLHEALGGLYRTPERFVIPFAFSMLIFLALTWGDRINALSFHQQLNLSLLVVFIILADLQVLRPFRAGLPDQELAFYEVIATDNADYVVVDVPVALSSGWARVGDNDRTQYHVLTHGKRIMTGYASRVPDWYHRYFRTDTVIGWLAGYQFVREDTFPTLEQYVDELPIGYVIVHQDKLNAATQQAEYFIGHFNQLDFLCPVTVEGSAMIYGTRTHPDRCQDRIPPQLAPQQWQIDFGVAGDEFFIGLGFYRQEVIGGVPARWLGAHDQQAATIYLDVPTVATYTLTIEMIAFGHDRPVTVYANDQIVGQVMVSPSAFAQYEVIIPAGMLTVDTGIALRLETDSPQSATELSLSSDDRPLSVAITWLKIGNTD